MEICYQSPHKDLSEGIPKVTVFNFRRSGNSNLLTSQHHTVELSHVHEKLSPNFEHQGL